MTAWWWGLMVCLLAGCSTMYGPGMNVHELKAIAADKNAGVVCAIIQAPGGTGKLVSVNLDRVPKDAGSVTVDANCNVTMHGGWTVPVVEK